MAELVYEAEALSPGEPVFAFHVGMDRLSQAILPELRMDLVAPVERSVPEPVVLSGFEPRACELLPRPHQRAQEAGVQRILVIDPMGCCAWRPRALAAADLANSEIPGACWS